MAPLRRGETGAVGSSFRAVSPSNLAGMKAKPYCSTRAKWQQRDGELPGRLMATGPMGSGGPDRGEEDRVLGRCDRTISAEPDQGAARVWPAASTPSEYRPTVRNGRSLLFNISCHRDARRVRIGELPVLLKLIPGRLDGGRHRDPIGARSLNSLERSTDLKDRRFLTYCDDLGHHGHIYGHSRWITESACSTGPHKLA